MMASPVGLYRRLARTPRWLRRLTVIGAFAGYPLVIVGYARLVENGPLPVAVWAPIAIVLMSITIIGCFATYGFAGDRVRGRDQLDERERQMHDRAIVLSYGIVTTIFVAGLASLALAASGEPVVIRMEALTPLLIAAGVDLPLLPFGVMAWIEPDAPVDDDAASQLGSGR
jgi:hypothetical protein